MPAPATIPELVDLIRRSGLFDAARLDRVSAQCDQARTETCPIAMLDTLVDEGALTQFQADQLAQGRCQGFLVGGYRLLSRLGAGGMSQVFLAEAESGERRVALKILSPRLANDPVARERFAREASATASLIHPNIVRVVDVNTDCESPFLVMEYIDGVSLQAAVARHGTFCAGTAAFCGRQIALGLQKAHEQCLVHRDIKPANILLDRKGVAKILDLGIVRTVSQNHLTRRMGEKTILGTADYLAPEQAVNSSGVDTRADLYALGATLYFLLAGHPPFPELSAFEKIVRKQKEDPVPIETLRPDVPPGMAAVIRRLMARNPDDRYSTPAATAAALHPYAVPDTRFPHSLFLASTANGPEPINTPTEVPGLLHDESGDHEVLDPTTDIVSVAHLESPTTEVEASKTHRLTRTPVLASGQTDYWFLFSALGFVVVAIIALILIAQR